MSGIDYTALVDDDNAQLKAEFEDAVRVGIVVVQEAESGVSVDHVDLTLLPGSVIVEFVLRVLNGATDMVATTLFTRKLELENTVVHELSQATELAAVASEGDIAVVLDLATISISTGGSTTEVAAAGVSQTSTSATSSVVIAASCAALVLIVGVFFGGCFCALRSRSRKSWCSPRGGWWATHSRSREVSLTPVEVEEPCPNASDVPGAPDDIQARPIGLSEERDREGVDAVDAAPECPRCTEPMTWSWYNEGPYRKGWHCEYFARCGSSGANCGAHRWFCSACLLDICDKCSSEFPRGYKGKPKLRATEAAALRQQSTDIEVLSAAALHRLRQGPTGRGEDKGHGQVQSILSPMAAWNRLRLEASDLGEFEEHGQVQSILAPPVSARHRLTQEPGGHGGDDLSIILAPTVAARHCSRQEPGGRGGDEDHGQARSILAPPILQASLPRGRRHPAVPVVPIPRSTALPAAQHGPRQSPSLPMRRGPWQEGVLAPLGSLGWTEPLPDSSFTSL